MKKIKNKNTINNAISALLIFLCLLSITSIYSQENKELSSSHSTDKVLSKYDDINKLNIKIPRLNVIPKAATIPLITDIKKETKKYQKAKGPGFARKKAKQAKALTIDSIRAIEKLLEATQDKAQKFELLRRMAELYQEYAEFLLEDEIKKFEISHQKWVEAGQKGPEPTLNYTKSTNAMKKAAEIYKNLIENYSEFPNMDIICYELGKLLLRLGDDTGISYLEKIFKNYPKSKLLPEVYLALGDYYFEKYNMLKAKTYYGKILPFKTFEGYPYALYKLAWTFYNSPVNNEEEQKKNYENAIKALKVVVKLSQVNPNAEKVGLRSEAIKDLVMMFAEAEKTQEAMLYFKSIDSEDSYFMVLERLGWIYTDQGKYEKAQQVYEKLIREAPLRKNVVEVYLKLINVYYLADKPNLVVKGLENIVKNYFYKKEWIKKYSDEKDYIASITKDLEFTLRKHATEFHQYAQKSKQNSYFLRAAILYNYYLKLFPKSEHYYDISYYLADALFELEKYKEAAYQYLKVVKHDDKGKYFETSLLQAIYAFNEYINKQDTEKPQNEETDKTISSKILVQAKTIPQIKKDFIEALDMYVKHFPKKEDSLAMRYVAAEIYYKYGHYDEAIKRFQSLIKSFPTSKQAESAIYLVLGYYIHKKDWDAIINYSEELLQQKELETKPLYKDIHKLLIEVSYNKALEFESKKEYKKAAEFFIDFYKKFPKEQNAPRALYNAILNYFKDSRIDEAIGIAITLFKEYPNFEKRKDVLILLAESYEKLGNFELAATYYAKLYELWPQDPKASSALYNAGIIMKALKNYEQSLNFLLKFEAQYNKDPLIKLVTWNIAQVYEQSNKINEAIKYYERFYNIYKDTDTNMALDAKAKYIALNLKIANTSSYFNNQLQQLYKDLMFKYKKYPALEARKVVSEYLFEQANEIFENFQQEEFKSDVTKLEGFLKQKQKKLETLASHYQKIINLSFPEYMVASNVMLARSHKVFAELLLQLSEKKYDSLTEEDNKTLQNTLKQLAKQLLDQAISFYEKSYNLASEMEEYSKWSKIAYEELIFLAKDKYFNEKYFYPNIYYINYSFDKNNNVNKSSLNINQQGEKTK